MSVDTYGSHPNSPATRTGSTAAHGPAGRDAFFDNAKFFAVVLVGVSHAVGELHEHLRIAGAINLVLFAFHMPAFTVIAGYFSKSFDYSRRKIQRLVAGLLVPYLVFEILYTELKRLTTHDYVPLSILSPVWLDWFLICLFVWRLSSPIWRWIRWPVAISVLISLATNLIHLDRSFDLPRATAMLPFFVCGMMLRREYVAVLQRTWVRVLAGVTFAIALVGAYVMEPRVGTKLLYFDDTARRLHTPPFEATLLRSALLVGTMLMVAAFLSLVPRHRSWYTSLGTGTIYAYLLHGFFHRLAMYLGLYDHLASVPGLALIVVVSAAGMILLMTPPVRYATRWLIEPRLDWAFHTEPHPLGK